MANRLSPFTSRKTEPLKIPSTVCLEIDNVPIAMFLQKPEYQNRVI